MPTYGPFSPATIVNDASVGTVAWINPSNAGSEDGVPSNATNVDGGTTKTTNYLKATDYSPGIPPSERVVTVTLEIKRSEDVLDADDEVVDSEVKLVVGGAVQDADNQADPLTEWPGTLAYETYVFSVDLTAAQANASEFGAVLSAAIKNAAVGGPTDFAIAEADHFRITFDTVPITRKRPSAMFALAFLDEGS